MIQPGMMFGGEGPVMQGTWYNPTTGDAFTVRDSFFEDNQYVITTTDGRYLRYDQIQNYIQSDMKLDELKQLKKENTVKEEALPAEVSNLIGGDDIYFGGDINDMLLPEDAALINKPVNRDLGNIYATPTQQTQPIGYTTQPVQNMNTAIIEKALKNTTKPNFSINVKWDNYPSKEIEMLKDIMDIPTTEIVDWYLDNIQLDEFVMAFKVAIDDKISFGNEYKQTEVKVIKLEEPVEVPTQEDKVEVKTEQPKQKAEKPTRAPRKDKKDKKTTKK
jgi:hypothetical protein